MGDLTQILFYVLGHMEPMKNYQKMIFSDFFMQNSLNKLGNESVGNPGVKPTVDGEDSTCGIQILSAWSFFQ